MNFNYQNNIFTSDEEENKPEDIFRFDIAQNYAEPENINIFQNQNDFSLPADNDTSQDQNDKNKQKSIQTKFSFDATKPEQEQEQEQEKSIKTKFSFDATKPYETTSVDVSDNSESKRSIKNPKNKPVKLSDLLPEEREKREKEAYNEYRKKVENAFRTVAQDYQNNVILQKQKEESQKEVSEFKKYYRNLAIENIIKNRDELRNQGYTDDVINSKYPLNVRAGLANPTTSNSRLVNNGLQADLMSPTSDNDKGYIDGFTSRAYLPVERLQKYTGAELRREAVRTFYGYLGFEPDISEVAIKAQELVSGNENLFIRYNDNKPIETVFDLYESGNVLPSEDGDVALYEDKDVSTIEYALVARMVRAAGLELTPENVANYYKKFKELSQKKSEERLGDLKKYVDENLPEDKRTFLGEFLDGVTSVFKGFDLFNDSSQRNSFLRELFGEDAQKYLKYSETTPNKTSKAYDVLETIGDKNLDDAVRALLAVQQYKIALPESTMYRALNDKKNLTALYLFNPVVLPVLRQAFPETFDKIANKIAPSIVPYVPSFGQIGEFVGQLAPIITASMFTGGFGALATTYALTAKQLRDSDPDKYNMNMMVQVLPVGLGHIMNFAKPVIGTLGVAGTQMALGAGQTIVSYGINWKDFLDEKGNVDLRRFLPNLILDITSSGFDLPEAYRGLQDKYNPTPHQIMNMLVRTEDGQHAMFVKNPDTGVFELVPVKADKAEAWKAKQLESGKPFIEQVVSPEQFTTFSIQYGKESIKQALYYLFFGKSNPVRELSKQFKDNSPEKTIVVNKDGKRYGATITDNPEMIITGDGVVPVNSGKKVAKELTEATHPKNDNKEFSLLNLLYNFGIPLSKFTSLLGSEESQQTIKNLQDNGYITIDNKGNIRLTENGVRYTEKLNSAILGFEKFVDDSVTKLGDDFDPQSPSDVTGAMKDNQFFSLSRRPFSYSIQEIMAMGQKQKQALAMKVARGDAEFNRNTGMLQNKEFEINGQKIGRDEDAYIAAKTYAMEEAFRNGNVKLANAIAKDILEFQGKDSSPESINKFVEGDPEAPELSPQPSGSLIEKISGKTKAPETLTVKDINDRTQYFHKETIHGVDVWKKAGQSMAIPDSRMRALVDDGTFSIVGEAPRSWKKVRESTKKNYKEASGAVKANLIPATLSREDANRIYADEGDVYNVAVFNKTAKEWREANPEKATSGKNMRDYATVEQLEILDRLEQKNKELINAGIDLPTRVVVLNREAIRHAKALELRKKVQKELQIPKKLKPEDTEREIKALSKLFGNETPEAKAKYSELATAMRNNDDVEVARLLKELVPDTGEKTAVLGNYYKAARNILVANDFAMSSQSIPAKIRSMIGLTPDTPFGLSIDDHRRNIANWIIGGSVKADEKTVIKLDNPEWEENAPAHFEQSKADSGIFYVNDELLDNLRRVQGKPTGVLGITSVSASRIKNIVDAKLLNYSGAFKEFSEALEKLGHKPIALIRINNTSMSYDSFVDVQMHEGTHKQVLQAVGGVDLFSDNTILSSIFNTPEGKIISEAIRNHSVYKGIPMNQAAHEILAYGSNLKTLPVFNIETPEQIAAFSVLYARLLSALEKEHGDKLPDLLQKYQDRKTREKLISIKEALEENERRIKQNQLQTNKAGLGLSAGERTGKISGNDTGTVEKPSYTPLKGSGLKRLRIRRYTRDGNPFSLTEVAGSEKLSRIRDKAQPTLNFFVMKEDGTFSVEPEFERSHWKFFETDFEGNLADLAQEPELAKIYRESPFPKFQKTLEELGYNGFFYYDAANWGDAFNYRIALFGNETNKTLLGYDDFAMAGEVFHGSVSPAFFEKFDSRFLLSGEGNLAYGAGWYFAEDKNVAEFYRKSYSKPAIVTDGENAGIFSPNIHEQTEAIKQKYGEIGLSNLPVFMDLAKSFQELYKENPSDFVRLTKRQIVNTIENLKNMYEIKISSYNSRGLTVQELLNRKYLDFLTQIENDFNDIRINKGHLLKAEIKPDLSELIDLDKPLSEQPLVRNTMVSFLKDTKLLDDVQIESIEKGSLKGFYLVKLLEQTFRLSYSENNDFSSRKINALAQLDTSKLLRNLGFKGNVFFDRNSRKKQEGFRNYVIFADDDVDILARGFDASSFEMAGLQNNLMNSNLFRKWVSDSAMFDEKGMPVVLYRGIDSESKASQLGIQLATRSQMFNGLPENPKMDKTELYVANFKNPLVLDKPNTSLLNQLKSKSLLSNKEVSEYKAELEKLPESEKNTFLANVLNKLGYDSVKYWDTENGQGWTYIALNSEQVKSAFDPQFSDAVNRIKEQEEFAMAKANTPERRENDLMKSIYHTLPEEMTTKDITPLLTRGFWGAISAVKDGDTSNHEKLKNELKGLGYKIFEVEGKYGGVTEPAFFVYYPNPETSRIIQVLANKYNQESALHAKGGEYWLEYNDGSIRKGSNITISGVETNDFGIKLQEDYAKYKGIKINAKEQPYLKPPEPEIMQKLADARMQDKHAPDDTEVQKAYTAFLNETNEQYDYVLKSGIKIEAWDGQGEPYKNSRDMLRDITENNHYYYLKTESAFTTDFPDHPILADSGKTDSNGRPLPYNDVFRIVHDLMGHTGNQWQFGIRGEWNAFASHAKLYSEEALPALMSETFLQNAVVAVNNYKFENGEYKLAVNPENIKFDEQKASIPSKEIQDTIKQELNKSYEQAVSYNDSDGTFLRLKNGTVRFSVDFDWSDEALIPKQDNYDLSVAEARLQTREKLKNTTILTPDDLSKVWSGETEWVDAQNKKIEPNAVFDSTGKKVGYVKVDRFGQEYVKIKNKKINLVNGIGKDGEVSYYVSKTNRDMLASVGMYQELMKMFNPDNQLTRPDNPKDLEIYNAKRVEIYKANIKRILDQWNQMSPEAFGALWYNQGFDKFAEAVGRDVREVGTDIGKLWLALATALTSPNTVVLVNTQHAVNMIATIFRFYETGKLTLPKFYHDENGNIIVNRDNKPKQFGLGSLNIEKIEMLTKGYVPANSIEGLAEYNANKNTAKIVTAKEILGDDVIDARTKYIKSPTAEATIEKYGALHGVINYLLSESVGGKKFNKAVDILGDKLGAFFTNLAGQTQIPTIDTWMNRYFMGMTGEALKVIRDENGNIQSIKDNSVNFKTEEGDFFRATIQQATKEWNAENGKNLTPADVQAIIWTQIKHLFNSLTKLEYANVDYSEAYNRIMSKVNLEESSVVSSKTKIKPDISETKLPEITNETLAPQLIDRNFGQDYFVEQDSGITFAMARREPFDAKLKSLDETSIESFNEWDLNSWIDLASSLSNNGFLSEAEINKIAKLHGSGDVTELLKYVLSMNKMGVLELFVNVGRISLLVGTKNIAKNLAGNTLKIFMDELSKVPMPVINLALLAVNKLAGGTNFDKASLSLLENPVAYLRTYKEAFGAAFTTGLKNARDTITGQILTNFEHPVFSRERTTGWRILKPLELFERYGWRFQGALDKPFYTFGYQRAISELQTLRQKEQIEAGNNISYAEAAQYLTPADYELAEYIGLNSAFQEDNRLANAYYNLVEGLPPTWRAIMNNVFKFVKTPLNVVDAVLDYSGFWQLAKMGYNKYKSEDFTDWKTEIKKALDNPQDRLAISKMISQGLIGSVMLHIGFKLAENGFIQGFYDEDDKKEKDYMEAKNVSYGTLNIKGKNVDISWLSPVAFYLLSGASMFIDNKKYNEKLENKRAELSSLEEIGASEEAIAKARQELTKLEASSPSMEVVNRILKNLALQTPFLRQGYDLVKSIEQNKLGEGLFNMMIQPEIFVPSIVKEIAQTMDTTARVTDDSSLINQAVDKVKSRIPVVRESLPVKYDMLGRPIETSYGIDPFSIKNINSNDPVINELEKYNLTIPKPTVGNSVDKNAERKIRGDFYRPYLDNIVNSEQYQNLSDYGKAETLKDSLRYLSTARKENKAEEYVNYKIDIIKTGNYISDNVFNNPEKYTVDTIDDKETVMNLHRANIDPQTVSVKNIVNSMGRKEFDKFINDMIRKKFEPNERLTIQDAKTRFQEFKNNPAKFIVAEYINTLENKNKRERLSKWREELRNSGKSEEQIEKEIRSRSSKLGKQVGYQYRKNRIIKLSDSPTQNEVNR